MIDGVLHLMTWLGILFCLSQSAIFSGLNLALFGISRLRLEVEAAAGNSSAQKILRLRKDSNFLLTTILWGNVAINVLLALLSNSVMVGVTAFLFSTVLITLFGEIMPQAYFSRNALIMGSRLVPLLRIYQLLLLPVAKPSAMLLDWWLGKEGIQYFPERDLRAIIRKHIEAEESDIDRLEGIGALNFLALDDLLVSQEGVPIDPDSIISLPEEEGRLLFPAFEHSVTDSFVRQLNASGKKWIILTNPSGEPRLVLNCNDFLRAALLAHGAFNPYHYCHQPIIVKDPKILLGKVISHFKVSSQDQSDDVIHEDLVLLWAEEKRVITGTDILGRLLQGIAKHHTGGRS